METLKIPVMKQAIPIAMYAARVTAMIRKEWKVKDCAGQSWLVMTEYHTIIDFQFSNYGE